MNTARLQVNQCIEELLEVEEKHQKNGKRLHAHCPDNSPLTNNNCFQPTTRVHCASGWRASDKTHRSKSCPFAMLFLFVARVERFEPTSCISLLSGSCRGRWRSSLKSTLAGPCTPSLFRGQSPIPHAHLVVASLTALLGGRELHEVETFMLDHFHWDRDNRIRERKEAM
jgi:hypothetical protein